ncbi:MAG: ABC transporter substrate-binding protein [Actinomycetota bacterium]|nr:ABC transporter substrate-binding protein [Actinomycetota bacterium]MDH5312755.1 ABC transporter substrate-binding protein [Actinomycetota bacterium]
MTKWMRLLALVAVLSLVAAACGDDSGDTGGGGGGGGTTASGDPDDPTITEVGAGEGEVSIIAWAGYIEDGSTDENYDWVTSFEEETGCEVTVTTAGTSDEMVALMQEGAGQYDLVTASGDASLRLVAGGTVQPVNLDLISSYSTVDERLQDAPWFTVDTDGDGTTEHYGVPYQWGSNVLMYSTDAFKGETPDSWSVVFEEQTLPDGKSNKGRVQAYDGAIYIADAALYLKATQPDLGIEDPYALSQEQFDAALDLLRQQRDLIGRYWHDAFVQMDDFVNGEAVVSSSWPFQVNFIEGAGKDFSSVVPKEGATGWADTTMMHTEAPHPNCAYLWMEHSLDPTVQGDLASWFGSVPAVPAACDGNELLGPDGCVTNGIENFDQIEFWKTPQSDCFAPDSGAVCVPYQQWVTNYVAVIGGR